MGLTVGSKPPDGSESAAVLPAAMGSSTGGPGPTRQRAGSMAAEPSSHRMECTVDLVYCKGRVVNGISQPICALSPLARACPHWYLSAQVQTGMDRITKINDILYFLKLTFN